MTNKKVLIIEDEPALLDMYTRKFENAGCTVFSAKDGETAVEMALREKPEYLVIDLFIPKKDGMEVLSELRTKLPNSKLIIATNLDQPEKELEAKKNGADGYLLKAKYLPKELVEKVLGF